MCGNMVNALNSTNPKWVEITTLVVALILVLLKMLKWKRYLPPFSPDPTPIEKAFAQLETLIRSAAERTVNGLQRQIEKALDAFLETECANSFRHAGYA